MHQLSISFGCIFRCYRIVNLGPTCGLLYSSVPGVTIPVYCVVEYADMARDGKQRGHSHAEFVLIRKDILFTQLVETALMSLGYTQGSAVQARGVCVYFRCLLHWELRSLRKKKSMSATREL